jgi:5-bromo-4-chloroindolyl phosphate hydrolysis protein
MANKNYPVRPDSSPKAAPVRKKDVTEVLLEVNELAEKLLEQMAELNTKYTVLQKDGLPLRMEGRSRELFETLLGRMKELPVQVDKAAAAGMEKSIKRLDAEITKIRNYCIIGTIVINVLFAFLAFGVLM